VPKHLRDSSYRGAARLGHGAGYVYPHDAPEGWVPQEHLPPELAGEHFYRPGRHGAEPALTEALDRRRRAQDVATAADERERAQNGADDGHE
jgi:putative ATPase